MHCFCINLDRSPKRLAYMRDQATALGFDIERIAAVDGADVPGWLAEQFRDSPLLPGEIGCYASHLVAARAILDRSLPFAVVLEDDVPLARDLVKTVHAAIAAAPSGWDFIHLTDYNLRTLVRIADLGAGRSLVRYTRFPKNTNAYVLSSSGARKWLNARARLRPSDVDVRYAWQFDFDIVGVYPAVAKRGSRFASDIDGTGAVRRPIRRGWSPGVASRLYGALWQSRRLGMAHTIVGQVINATNALRRQPTTQNQAPVVLSRAYLALVHQCVHPVVHAVAQWRDSLPVARHWLTRP